MEQIKITINGQTVTGNKGETYLILPLKTALKFPISATLPT